MTVYNLAWQKGGLAATGGPIGVGNSQLPFAVSKTTLNLNKILNGTNNIASQAITTGDAVIFQQLPANTVLVGLQVIVTITDNASSSVSVGDSGSATRFVSAAATLTAGTVLTQAVTTNPLRFYSTADSLRMTFNGTYVAATSVGEYRFVIYTADASADPISTTQA